MTGADYSDLRALYVNCTLKRSPEPSNTQALADRSIAIMRRNGVTVDVIRAVDHEIASGVYPDMTEHGWAVDEWPQVAAQVMAADILYSLQHLGYTIPPQADSAWLGEAGPARATAIPAQAVRRTTSRTATPRF